MFTGSRDVFGGHYSGCHMALLPKAASPKSHFLHLRPMDCDLHPGLSPTHLSGKTVSSSSLVPGGFPLRSVSGFMCSPASVARGCQLLVGRPWFPPSQHLPVFLCVSLPKGTPGLWAEGGTEGQEDGPRLLARLSRGKGRLCRWDRCSLPGCQLAGCHPVGCQGLRSPFLSSQLRASSDKWHWFQLGKWRWGPGLACLCGPALPGGGGGGGSRLSRQLRWGLLGTGVEAVGLSMSLAGWGQLGTGHHCWLPSLLSPAPCILLTRSSQGVTWGRLGANAAPLSLLPVAGSRNGFLGFRPLYFPFPLSVGWSW